jgi:hypothetical protein
MKRAPESLGVTSYEENAERFSSYYLRLRSRDKRENQAKWVKSFVDKFIESCPTCY